MELTVRILLLLTITANTLCFNTKFPFVTRVTLYINNIIYSGDMTKTAEPDNLPALGLFPLINSLPIVYFLEPA